MIKNTAGQRIGAQMVATADGSAFTGAVTVSVTGDAGTQATGSVGAGACTHEGNGYHTYAPAQAETNYDLIAFTFTGSGAIPTSVQVYTAAGDAFTRLGAPAGASVSADVAAVKAETATILADTNDIQTRLPAALVSGRIDASVGAMAANVLTATAINADAITAAKVAADVTTEIQTGLATAASITTLSGLVDDLETRLGTPSNLGSGATIAANLVDIEGQTDDIGAAGAGLTALGDTRLANLDATVSSRLSSAGYTTPPTVAAIADGVWDEATAGHVSAGTFGEQVKTDVDAILADTGTDGVIVVTNNDKTGYAIGVGGIGATAFASGAINAAALAADAVDEILDEQIGDSTITMRQALKVIIAGFAGKVSGAGTASITIRNYADSSDVIVGAVDGAGNRTSTTLTV